MTIALRVDGGASGRDRAGVISTQHVDGRRREAHQAGSDRACDPAGAAARTCRPRARPRFRLRQSDRQVRDRWPDGRYRLDRAQDHRRHLRGWAPHGGGAFSGKDPTKVDRSAAYAARYVAKNVVAAGLADRCQVQVAYAIGVARPVSVNVECFGTEAEGISMPLIEELIAELFDLRPAAIQRDLDLWRPIYTQDRGLRPFRPRRQGLHLGAHRQGRCVARGGRARSRGRGMSAPHV